MEGVVVPFLADNDTLAFVVGGLSWVTDSRWRSWCEKLPPERLIELIPGCI